MGVYYIFKYANQPSLGPVTLGSVHVSVELKYAIPYAELELWSGRILKEKAVSDPVYGKTLVNVLSKSSSLGFG